MPNKKQRRKRKFEDNFEELQKRCLDESPKRGHASSLKNAAFSALPISTRTLEGLSKSNFHTMTAIQNAVLPHALAGRDILGAAKTGSGKTLAFLVPVLERLNFQSPDGPAALIISPTRELSQQIFAVLTSIGHYHDRLTAGLLIGGRKDFYAEQQHVGDTNILVATPGRLLQHLEQTVGFDTSEVSILVLDEADRCLDLGFRTQIQAILDYLPKQIPRQTLLFSATQSKDVASLAKLSLYKPEYIGVHDQATHVTPESLQQSYVVIPLQHKLNAVYSFLRTHLQCKSILFFSTCAQVRHAHTLLCGLRPGLSVLALHGKLSQEKRSIVLEQFERSNNKASNQHAAALLCTDMCARGIDFDQIDWVVQVDAPESVDTYIHRVGRTARYRNAGKSLLFLTEQEDKNGFMDSIMGKSKAKIPIQKLGINASQATTVTDRAASMTAANAVLHGLAKKAFQSYVRSIHFMPNHSVFRVESMDFDGLAQSLGLASTPNLQFLKQAAPDREQQREKKNVNHKLQRLKEQIKTEKLAKKLQKLPNHAATANDTNGTDSDEDEVLVPKETRQNTNSDDEEVPPVDIHKVTSGKRPDKRIRIDGHGQNKRVVFDDDGKQCEMSGELFDTSDRQEPIDPQQLADDSAAYMETVRLRLAKNKEEDEAEHKERVRQKHKKRRLEEKGGKDEVSESATEVVLNRDVVDDGSDEGEGDASSSSGSSSSTDDSSVASSIDLQAQEDLALAMIRNSAE